jgi:hypothetical protein
MAVQAAVTKFREETVAQFEQKRSKLAGAATKESMMNGLSAVFLVNGSAGDTAVTRGANGDIPYGGPTNSQVTITLAERHAAKELTGFDVFASQGNQAQGLRNMVSYIMQRDQDLTVLAALAAATNDFGTGTLDLTTVLGARAILGNNDVPTEEADNMFGVVSPAAEAYMLQWTEFSNAQYVDIKPFAGAATVQYRRWAGINWIVSNKVTGVGTSAEILYIWHRAALGYAANLTAEKVYAGFEERHGRSWARAELYHQAGVLQNSGIIKITHDGSAFVAT